MQLEFLCPKKGKKRSKVKIKDRKGLSSELWEIQRVSINKTFNIRKGLSSVSGLILSENRNPFVLSFNSFRHPHRPCDNAPEVLISVSVEKESESIGGQLFSENPGFRTFWGQWIFKALVRASQVLGLVNWNQYLYILRDKFAWTPKSFIPWMQFWLSKFWACSAIPYFHFLNSTDAPQAFRLVASNSFHWNLHEQEAYQPFKRAVFKHIH